MATYMLTTTDNPYDPFMQFDDWLAYDVGMGYHTCSLLARVVVTSEELSEADQDVAMELAIDSIVNENSLGNYRKLIKDSVKIL